jgi:hypothetical protein
MGGRERGVGYNKSNLFELSYYTFTMNYYTLVVVETPICIGVRDKKLRYTVNDLP